MRLEISDLIKKAFDYYDKQNEIYKDYINDTDIQLDKKNSKILFKKTNKEFTYEALGVFDNENKIWIWAWLMPFDSNNKKKISNDLLSYGLKLEPNNDQVEFYLKTQLLNSRFLLDDSIQLDIHLALACYLSKDRFRFLYPRKWFLDKDKKKFLTMYHLIL